MGATAFRVMSGQYCGTVCGFHRSKQACLLGKLLAVVI
jgi:hypothetical protein